MAIRFIRLAHDLGLGCGDTREIEIVGDKKAAEQSWSFAGPKENLTFAAKMQHEIYWGRLKKPIEWSLKTWLAPWSYLASVIYHDLYWYPMQGNNRVHEVLQSDWGRLFHNWEKLSADSEGYKSLGEPPRDFVRGTKELLKMGTKILGTAIKEAPEVRARLRRK
jgi:hypothetical protein